MIITMETQKQIKKAEGISQVDVDAWEQNRIDDEEVAK